MINPFKDPDDEDKIVTGGRGIRRLAGDTVPGIKGAPGDSPLGEKPLPGDYRMAGSKIKGMAQYDPTIYKKLFA